MLVFIINPRMGPESRKKYIDMVQQRIVRGQANLESLEDARNNAESRKTSRYDTQREIFNGDANIQRDLLERLNQFREVIEGAVATTRIEPGAEFSIELWDEEDEIKGALYSPVTVVIPGVTIISPDSPIGNAIKGMVTGNTFVYKVNNQLLAGRITDIQ